MAPLFFTELESTLREKEHLEKILAGMRKDYEAEIANLKSENRELKTRASEEKKEREKFQELVKAKEGEILSLRGELEVIKGEVARYFRICWKFTTNTITTIVIELYLWAVYMLCFFSFEKEE